MEMVPVACSDKQRTIIIWFSTNSRGKECTKKYTGTGHEDVPDSANGYLAKEIISDFSYINICVMRAECLTIEN